MLRLNLTVKIYTSLYALLSRADKGSRHYNARMYRLIWVFVDRAAQHLSPLRFILGLTRLMIFDNQFFKYSRICIVRTPLSLSEVVLMENAFGKSQRLAFIKGTLLLETIRQNN